MSRTFDVIMIAEPRFAGGTSSALIADVQALSEMGVRIGLLFVQSSYLRDGVDLPNRRVLDLLDLSNVEMAPSGGCITAETVFLHHPMIFYYGVAERVDLSAKRAIVVAHQAPFRGDGSLEYDPLSIQRTIHRSFGLRPLWAPISGLCRQQLECFAPLIRLTSEDWINVFDPADWVPRRTIFSDRLVTIGRHGRADPMKWPASAIEVEQSLPVGSDRRIRVMGCPQNALNDFGTNTGEWNIIPFGAQPVTDFIDALDVFSYHHHPRWTETFGRTVAEAALMGRICILGQSLAATFKDIAIIAPPPEVSAIIDRLAADPAAAQTQGTEIRRIALARYSRDSITGRLQRISKDEGTVRRNDPTASPLRTARKIIGLRRRRRAGGA